MALVSVSIGSNIDREHHVRACLTALSGTFDGLAVSRVYESEPVGFEDGRNFFNLAATFESDWTVGELQAWCKRIEREHGRRKDTPKFSPRTLDIDLLTVGSLVGEHDGVMLPRDEILHHAFVLLPLSELLPDTPHPEVGRTYAELWSEFKAGSQRLWPVAFASNT
ncbi:2-amino-4-hydroxy-6-hydroxymethyldihydropteridine diphosphokinase [Billgrantia kenyensis]|uniref:2-amino-4-hydroxy-6-hydroxymethyldihydropteridine diphosphokinase n=1 Tax=Billgrantia kenyensis TaxID=321266 RepID=A0A7V9W2M6_9GAMM|nr:2-amino-4-hydroxy-6-hydroxymethyldihydropteridine diphosphokinase [Halomonas kenyensis]MBA2779870.1 2-amino-4-hydroxy-6-hydroxymethyldihydropteridine diphosphokinase [Halomonas kenyensis]MCG6662004.1 2-amino-4-hydroxy-6-hydroxymethyldihydropteridine diphosphokinase [Halomonas kenyensis]